MQHAVYEEIEIGGDFSADDFQIAVVEQWRAPPRWRLQRLAVFKASGTETNLLAADVDVVRKSVLYLGFTHGYMCQIVFIDFSGGVLMVAEILEGLTKIIEGLLPGLTCSNELGFRGRQGDVVLTSALKQVRCSTCGCRHGVSSEYQCRLPNLPPLIPILIDVALLLHKK